MIRRSVTSFDGSPLCGLERGEGVPLVWAHGLLSSKESALAALRDVREHRLIAFDQRGHGDSVALVTPQQATLDHFAGDLLAVLDALEIESAIIGGESMGAAAVLQFAVQHPGRTRGLLVDRPAIGATGSSSRWREEAPIVAAEGVDRWMESAIRDLPTEAQTAVRNRYQHHWRRHQTASVAAIFEALSDWYTPSAPALSTVDHPAVVRSWPDDPVHPIALAERLASVLPRGRFVPVDRALYYDEAQDARSLASCVSLLKHIASGSDDAPTPA